VILVPCNVLGLLTVDHYDVSSVETCSSAVVHSATEQDALGGVDRGDLSPSLLDLG
jgi:hypothetical protein